MGYRKHREHAPKSVNVGILVVSDSVYRGDREDLSGKLAAEILREAGHNVATLECLPNDPKRVRAWVSEKAETLDVILVIGGTGLSSRDRSIEAVTPLFSKRLPGFGELFRLETYKTLGSASWLTRADAGLVKKALVFITPGSPDAVETALRIILPELGHAVYIARS